MSQQVVGIVIDRLLTDEDLRARFAWNRIEAVIELSLDGLELTSDEIDAFVRTDARVWFLGSAMVGWRAH